MDWEQARRRFVQREKYSRSINLTPPDWDPVTELPAYPFTDIISYDEQLDFAVKKEFCIKPILFAHDYEYRTPFLHPEWIKFILSVPRRYRKNQYLYKLVLKQAYSDLFSLPAKTTFGLSLNAPHWRRQWRYQIIRLHSLKRRIFPGFPWGVHPMTNYIDFDAGLREREDLRSLIKENLYDLNKRGIVDWLNIDRIWHRHQHKKANHADALIMLASLEINLKFQEKEKKERIT